MADMSDSVLIGMIFGSTTILTALSFVLVVYRGVRLIERRLESMESNLGEYQSPFKYRNAASAAQ
jgi:hypothetical protein